MDPRRLEMLLELSRLGSMREVAASMHTTTSTISQQLGVLAREAGVELLEPDGRRVRLTPAGRRLAEHAVTVLAALEAARADLDPRAAPAGVVRVAAFASAIRRRVLPVVTRLADEHPDVRLVVREHEPNEAVALLDADEVDLVIGYDYNLAPAASDPTTSTGSLYATPWGLGVPADRAGVAAQATDAAATVSAFRDSEWIVNSRNTADDEVLRVACSLAGFAPRITHRADSLDLVADMVLAGLGVGLLPLDRDGDRVAVLPVREPDLELRARTVVRRGREQWPPLALVLDLLRSPDQERDQARG
ncbi:LysR family transcriptional regulator [Nocardioides mangrovicus]|uniref:LysR family transcriptional regulator n=1 Tax=Nocardioides mangrovicus TaxID=2478913 RepID=A0A3L8P1N0_9ACTN|nr:LysR family transcriptional regulator [Nocardioides mangrovicus]RLV48842.1 LysR family transcriptional regulator [Nocardioides mangrovicus]